MHLSDAGDSASEARVAEALGFDLAAIARGELPRSTDASAVIKTVLAPIYLRLLITAEPIDDATADLAARVALAASRAGVLARGAEKASDICSRICAVTPPPSRWSSPRRR